MLVSTDELDPLVSTLAHFVISVFYSSAVVIEHTVSSLCVSLTSALLRLRAH